MNDDEDEEAIITFDGIDILLVVTLIFGLGFYIGTLVN